MRLQIGWEFRRWEDGSVLSTEDLSRSCEQLYGEHTWTAHRADLIDVLRSAVPDGYVRLGKRLSAVKSDDDTAQLTFDDGAITEADIVIGADGIHSLVRRTLVGSAAATPSGLRAYRALVPATEPPAFALRPAQTLWIGAGHHLVHYPVAGGRPSPRRSAPGPPSWHASVRPSSTCPSRAATATALAADVDAIVSVGGGSSTGLAKAVALETGAPIVVLPTTFSGSEATNVWGLTEDSRKTTGSDPRVLPTAVVYDPALLTGLPA